MHSHFSFLLETLARKRFAGPPKPPPLVRLGTSLRRCRLRLHTTPFLLSASARFSPSPFLLMPFSSARPSASRILARSLSRLSPSLRAGGLYPRALLATCRRRSRFQSHSSSTASPLLLRLHSPRHLPVVLPARVFPRPHRVKGPLVSSLSLRSPSMVSRCVNVTATTYTRRPSTTRHLPQLSRAPSPCRLLFLLSPRPVERSFLSCSEERRCLL